MIIKLSEKPLYTKINKQNITGKWKKGEKIEAWYVVDSSTILPKESSESHHPEGVCLDFFINRYNVSIVISKEDLVRLQELVDTGLTSAVTE